MIFGPWNGDFDAQREDFDGIWKLNEGSVLETQNEERYF